MSGGHFDYAQCRIHDIEDEIQELINSNNDESLNEFGEKRGYFYSVATIARFKEAVEALQIARIYAQRIDWLVSGDDGEESFHKRLDEELNETKKGE